MHLRFDRDPADLDGLLTPAEVEELLDVTALPVGAKEVIEAAGETERGGLSLRGLGAWLRAHDGGVAWPRALAALGYALPEAPGEPLVLQGVRSFVLAVHSSAPVRLQQVEPPDGAYDFVRYVHDDSAKKLDY